MATSHLSRDELLARTDLVALADELLGPHAGTARSPAWACPAPGHGPQTGKTPPVGVFVSHAGTPRYRCHGCGEGGTAIDLVMATRGASVGDALRYLAERAGLDAGAGPPPRPHGERRSAAPRPGARPQPVAARQADPAGAEAVTAYVAACERLLWRHPGAGVRQWLAARGLGPDILAANRVGADPGPKALPRPPGLPRGGLAAVFPVLDDERSAVYLQARYLDPAGVGRRYDNPAERLAGPNPKMAAVALAAPPRGDAVVVCEGMPDALTLAQQGLASVAILGVGVPDAALAARLVERFAGRRLVVAFDRDANEAGQRGARRLGGLLVGAGAAEGVGVLTVPAPHNDLNAWAVAAGARFPAELAEAWTRVAPFEAAPAPAPTPAQVRAAVGALVDWHERGPASAPPADALALLRQAPRLPGGFGQAVAAIATTGPASWSAPLARLGASLGRPGHGGVGAPPAAALAEARDAALERALDAALRPGGADADAARAWAGVHDAAVDRLDHDGGGGPPVAPTGLGWDRAPAALESGGVGPDWGP